MSQPPDFPWHEPTQTALVTTQWHVSQGGYWEAQAWDTDANRLFGKHATSVEERVAVAVVIQELVIAGYLDIVVRSTTPITLWVRHVDQGWGRE